MAPSLLLYSPATNLCSSIFPFSSSVCNGLDYRAKKGEVDAGNLPSLKHAKKHTPGRACSSTFFQASLIRFSLYFCTHS